jgi:hypothetical protein
MSPHMSFVKSLGAGIGFTALFALYTLWFSAISPRENETLKIVASVQFTAAMTTLLILFCVPHIIYSASKVGRNETLNALLDQLPSVVRLSLWTLLGPALWTTAVALLEPSPATWLELGLIPLFTLLIGSTSSKRARHLQTNERILNLTAAALLILGVSIIFIDVWSLSFVGISILFSFLGALSTALAGNEIEKITARSAIPFSLVLFARFFLTAIVFSVFIMFFGGHLYLNSSIVGLIWWGAVLFVAPNFLYVYLIWKTDLRQSAYMWALLPIFISSGERLSGLYSPTLSTHALFAAGGAILIGAICNAVAEQRTAGHVPAQ